MKSNLKLNTLAGGAWRNEARISIKDYLTIELKAEVKAGEVLIIG